MEASTKTIADAVRDSLDRAAPSDVATAVGLAGCAPGNGLKKLVPLNLVQRIMEFNGASALACYHNGQPHSVVTLDAAEGRIRGIYIATVCTT